MYIVTIQNGSDIKEIHGTKQKLTSGKVTQGINTIDSFVFTMLPGDIGFNSIFDFTTLVNVFNTNTSTYEFFGRALYTSTEMSDDGMISKQVTCESYFGYLCDSVQEYVEEQNWTVRGLLEHIIDCHNKYVEIDKHFAVRTVTVEDPNDNLYVGIQRENTWDTIKKKLIDVLGGELIFEVGTNTIYLDYVQRIGEDKSTKIALSDNMKSIVRERDPSSLITRLIPLGAKIDDNSERRFTVDSVNDGLVYIDNIEAVEAYGIHVGVVEWDDVTKPSILKTKAIAWLEENNKVPVRYSVTALDLSLLGYAYDSFQLGNSHPLKNSLLGINDTGRIVKRVIDICEEVKSSFEIGEKFKTLSEIQEDQRRENKAIMTDIKNGTYVRVTDKDKVVKMVNDANGTVQLTGNRIIISSDNLGITADGTLTARRGVFEECTIEDSCKIYGTLLSDTISSKVYTDSVGTNIEGSIKFTAFDDNTKGYEIGVTAYSSGETSRWAGVRTYSNLGLGEVYIGCDEYDENGGFINHGTGIEVFDSYVSCFSKGTISITSNEDTFVLAECKLHLTSYGDLELVSSTAITSNTEIEVTSDANVKNSIVDVDERYSLLFDSLRPRMFRYDYDSAGKVRFGFVAQEVGQAFDAAGLTMDEYSLIHISDKGTDKERWALGYTGFIALAVAEIQKLKAEVKSLKEKIPTGE